MAESIQCVCPECGKRLQVALPPPNKPDPPGKAIARWLKQPGSWLVIVGLCIVLFFWVVYDTTGVYLSYQQANYYASGLQHNRLAGIIVGLGFMFVGAVLSAARPAKP